MVKQVVEERDDPNLRAEKSYVKWVEDTRDAGESPIVSPENEARYGMKGTLRIDVLENGGHGTVCVYDIKTGARGLSAARFDEIKQTVFHAFPNTQNIVITEVRPTQ